MKYKVGDIIARQSTKTLYIIDSRWLGPEKEIKYILTNLKNKSHNIYRSESDLDKYYIHSEIGRILYEKI
jgi:hypothetical protein